MKRLFFSLAALTCLAGFCGEPGATTVKGKAVAIHWFQVPINGVCSTDILLQASLKPNSAPEFVRVSVSIPEAEFDRWLAALPGMSQFSIIRDPSNDSVLKESVPIIEEGPGTTPKRPGTAPLWRLLKGNEGVALPFGKPIKAFRSSLWPVIPAV